MKIFRGSERKLPLPRTIPVRSLGDVKKEMTAKNGGEFCLTLSQFTPRQDPTYKNSNRLPFNSFTMCLIPIKRDAVYQSQSKTKGKR